MMKEQRRRGGFIRTVTTVGFAAGVGYLFGILFATFGLFFPFQLLSLACLCGQDLKGLIEAALCGAGDHKISLGTVVAQGRVTL